MDDNDPHCQHWRVCDDCYGRAHGERMESEIAQLRADLARVTAELNEAIEDRRQARDDAARAAALLAVRTMERDELATVHAELRALFPDRPVVDMVSAVREALRAHAAKVKP